MKIKQIILVLSVVMLWTCASCAPALALTQEEIAAIEKETWSISINTDVNDLYPAGIQYAIISEDPLPIYQANLARLKTNEKLQDDLSTIIAVSWDLIFQKVSGDQVALLAPRSENQFSVCSNEPGGKKWLITRVAAKSDGTMLCWCIPIEVKIGEKYSLKLDENNYFDLKKFL